MPGTPIRSLLERLDVLPKAHTDLGWIKQPVALLNAMAEGIYRRPGNFVDRNLRIRQRHRRLEDEQVVVTSVIHVDDS